MIKHLWILCCHFLGGPLLARFAIALAARATTATKIAHEYRKAKAMLLGSCARHPPPSAGVDVRGDAGDRNVLTCGACVSQVYPLHLPRGHLKNCK